MNISEIIDINSLRYDKLTKTSLHFTSFYSETSVPTLRNFCDLHELNNLVRELSFFKNLDNPSFIGLFLANCSKGFQET